MQESFGRFARLFLIVIFVMVGIGLIVFGGAQFLNRMKGVARAGGGIGVVPAMVCVFAGVALLATVYPILRKNDWGNRGPRPVDGRVGSYLADATEPRMLAGREFLVYYRRPKKGKHGHPSALTIKVPVATPITFQFKRETGYDRWAKNVGLATELQTEDAAFDDAVYVRTPTVEYAASYLADEDKRLAVRGLLEHGFKEVKLTGTDAEATWVGFDPLKNDQPELADYAAAGLFVLAGRLPEPEPGLEMAARDATKTWLVVLWGFVAALAATILVPAIYPPIRTKELMFGGIVTFVIVYPVFVFLAALLLRGTSTSHDRWALLVGIGLPLVVLGSIGATQLLNLWADVSPPHKRPLVIANKYKGHTSKGQPTYHIVVKDWSHPNETLQYAVSSGEFSQVAPGRSHLDLTTGDGWLGIEWEKERHIRKLRN